MSDHGPCNCEQALEVIRILKSYQTNEFSSPCWCPRGLSYYGSKEHTPLCRETKAAVLFSEEGYDAETE